LGGDRQRVDSNVVQTADPFLEEPGADGLWVRAAGSERLEPVSPLSVCLEVVLTGLLYLISSFVTGHLRKDLVPDGSDLSWRTFSAAVASRLRFKRSSASEAWSYNLLQRLSYLFVIFVLFPLIIWTGLAMSPAFVSAVPATVNLLGGQQSARTIHFFVSLALLLFVLVHVLMVFMAGFRSRMRAMITGRVGLDKDSDVDMERP